MARRSARTYSPVSEDEQQDDKRERWMENGLRFESTLLNLTTYYLSDAAEQCEDIAQERWMPWPSKKDKGLLSSEGYKSRYDTRDKAFEYFNKVLEVAIKHINIHLDESSEDNDVVINIEDKPDLPLEMIVGKGLQISLATCPSTGYQWQWRTLPPAIEITPGAFHPRFDDGRCGGGGKQIFTLKASVDGDFEVELFHAREILDYMSPSLTLKLKVHPDDAAANDKHAKDGKKSDEKAEAEVEEKALKTACSPAFVKAVEKADLKRKFDEILADESSMTVREKFARIEAAFDVKNAECCDTAMCVQFKKGLELLSKSCASLKRASAARDEAVAENLVLKALTLDMMEQRNSGAAGAKG